MKLFPTLSIGTPHRSPNRRLSVSSCPACYFLVSLLILFFSGVQPVEAGKKKKTKPSQEAASQSRGGAVPANSQPSRGNQPARTFFGKQKMQKSSNGSSANSSNRSSSSSSQSSRTSSSSPYATLPRSRLKDPSTLPGEPSPPLTPLQRLSAKLSNGPLAPKPSSAQPAPPSPPRAGAASAPPQGGAASAAGQTQPPVQLFMGSVADRIMMSKLTGEMVTPPPPNSREKAKIEGTAPQSKTGLLNALAKPFSKKKD